MTLPYISTGSPCLTESALRNLRHYRYSGIDRSPLSKYVLQPYWTFVARLFPVWMAPNLITLLGFLCVVGSLALALAYMPDLERIAPPWVYVTMALGIWTYSTLDNVDGKQARRTGTSSPLGEMFDHGCDALACALGALVQAAALGMGFSWYTVGVLLLTIIPFYVSTWEHFHTGSLYLGIINGPTEGIVMACVIMLLCGILGPDAFWQPLHNVLGAWILRLPPFVDMLVVEALLYGMFVLLVTTQLPVSFWTVFCATRANRTSFSQALMQLAPLAVLLLSVYAWLSCPSSVILSRHLVAFALLVGIVFGRLATGIILAHLVKAPFPLYSSFLLAIVVGAFLANVGSLVVGPAAAALAETVYLYLALAVVLLAYLSIVFEIIDRVCAFLNISCLTIGYRRLGGPDAASSASAANSSTETLGDESESLASASPLGDAPNESLAASSSAPRGISSATSRSW